MAPKSTKDVVVLWLELNVRKGIVDIVKFSRSFPASSKLKSKRSIRTCTWCGSFHRFNITLNEIHGFIIFVFNALPETQVETENVWM